MGNWTSLDFVVHGMVVFMLAVLFGALWTRQGKKGERKKSPTHRFIQFVGISWLIGAVVILSVTEKFSSESGTILGALAGYLFAMRRHDGQQKDKLKR